MRGPSFIHSDYVKKATASTSIASSISGSLNAEGTRGLRAHRGDFHHIYLWFEASALIGGDAVFLIKGKRIFPTMRQSTEPGEHLSAGVDNDQWLVVQRYPNDSDAIQSSGP
jgi:hypothetical protein